MPILVNFPVLIFVFSFTLLWLLSVVGVRVLRRRRILDEAVRDDFKHTLAAALTLLGLIVAFSFSMAVNRYDQRKLYEEQEANAIGTEYLRAGLLPEEKAAEVRQILRAYLHQRILFYTTRDEKMLRSINTTTMSLQESLWSSVSGDLQKVNNPMGALVVSGMNDVINAQGYAQASWWNRIPRSAWILMFAISAICVTMQGYCIHDVKKDLRILMIQPFVISISLFLIADLDSARYGVIRVNPQNLISLANSLPPGGRQSLPGSDAMGAPPSPR